MNTQEIYNFSFRCYFDGADGPSYTTHYQPLPISDIPRWLDAYRFTHPDCKAISVKIWFRDGDQNEQPRRNNGWYNRSREEDDCE